jgi:hypothetical protein
MDCPKTVQISSPQSIFWIDAVINTDPFRKTPTGGCEHFRILEVEEEKNFKF